MPPKNRNKFGLSIPVDPRWKALDGLGNTRSLPSTPNSNALETETEESQVQRKKKKLTKQLSLSERTRDMAWEKRRKQVYRQEKRRNSMEIVSPGQVEDLTDADLHELRGSIELGFGFSEQDQDGRHTLCHTLPALDLYFAVNRHLSSSPLSSPGSRRSSSSSSITSPQSDESWRICSPGDSPQQVKTKLRHWAQVVACSVMQSS